MPFLGTGLVSGLWIAFIGWFLASAAGQSYQQVVLRDFLENVPVKDLMRNDFTSVSPDVKVSQLVDSYLIGTDKRVFPVITDSKLEGIVCLEDIQKIPREEWERKKVRQIMTPYKELEIVQPSEEVSEAINKITRQNIGEEL